MLSWIHFYAQTNTPSFPCSIHLVVRIALVTHGPSREQIWEGYTTVNLLPCALVVSLRLRNTSILSWRGEPRRGWHMQREQLKDGECSQGVKALRERELKEAAGVLLPTTVPRANELAFEGALDG